MSRRRAGGRGESVLSDVPVGGKEGTGTHLPTNQTAGESVPSEDLDPVLLEVGVFVLSAPRRRELAAALAKEGWTARDVRGVRALLATGFDRDEGKVLRTLAAKLQAEDRAQVLADFRTYSERATHAPRPTAPGEGDWRAAHDRRRQFDAEWERYLDAKARGTLPPMPHRPMPWERN